MMVFQHHFVDIIPRKIDNGELWISLEHRIAVHLCACGCGLEVSTPLSPAQWTLKFDGETVSLDPSIGNWNFDCRSHYFIRHNRVHWARPYSDKEIAMVKADDRRDLLANVKENAVEFAGDDRPLKNTADMGLLARLKRLLDW